MRGLSKLPANHTGPFYDLRKLPVKSHLKNIYKDGPPNVQQHADLITHVQAENRASGREISQGGTVVCLPTFPVQNNGTEAMDCFGTPSSER